MRKLVLATSLAALAGFASPSAMAGDAAAGYQFAKGYCARCHDIEKGGAFKKRPPSLQSIAVYRTEDDIWARIIAPSPHSGMPETQWAMTADQVQDVLAYILTLDVPVALGP